MRAAPLSPQVKIYLQQDRPLLVKYEMGSSGRHNLGEAVFVLAPKCEDEPEYQEVDREPEAALPVPKKTSKASGKKRRAASPPEPAASPKHARYSPEGSRSPEALADDDECPEWD